MEILLFLSASSSIYELEFATLLFPIQFYTAEKSVSFVSSTESFSKISGSTTKQTIYWEYKEKATSLPKMLFNFTFVLGKPQRESDVFVLAPDTVHEQ